jgi:hypothetical protein
MRQIRSWRGAQEHAPRRQESAHENASRPDVEMRIGRRREKLALHLTEGNGGGNPMCISCDLYTGKNVSVRVGVLYYSTGAYRTFICLGVTTTPDSSELGCGSVLGGLT